MKQLTTLHLKSASILTESEMKQVLGGSGSDWINNACYVGRKCSVYDASDKTTTTGTCQGKSTGGSGTVECYCDSWGTGSGSGNSDGISNCAKK